MFYGTDGGTGLNGSAFRGENCGRVAGFGLHSDPVTLQRPSSALLWCLLSGACEQSNDPRCAGQSDYKVWELPVSVLLTECEPFARHFPEREADG